MEINIYFNTNSYIGLGVDWFILFNIILKRREEERSYFSVFIFISKSARKKSWEVRTLTIFSVDVWPPLCPPLSPVSWLLISCKSHHTSLLACLANSRYIILVPASLDSTLNKTWKRWRMRLEHMGMIF